MSLVALPLMISLLAPGWASADRYPNSPAPKTSAAGEESGCNLETTPPAGPEVLTRREQVSAEPAGPPPPRHPGVKAMVTDLVDDVKHLPSKENALWAGLGGGLALAVHPADDNVNEAVLGSDFAHNFFKVGKYLGELYTLLPVAAATYTVGRIKDQPKISHVGMDYGVTRDQ
jgi:hypothetical protein